MDIQQVLTRVSELQQALAPVPPAAPSDPSQTSSFQDQLDAATAALQQDPTASAQGPNNSLAALALALRQAPPATSPFGAGDYSAPSQGEAAAVLTDAEREVGQSETTTNDGPAIARYRTAVSGSQPGDAWCAEFVSYVAAEAGEPLGYNGQGFRSVSDLTSWAAESGKLLPASATPAPGDLILFGSAHVGVVEKVNADGSIDTVEGNYGNQVAHVHRHPGEWTGFVSL